MVFLIRELLSVDCMMYVYCSSLIYVSMCTCNNQSSSYNTTQIAVRRRRQTWAVGRMYFRMHLNKSMLKHIMDMQHVKTNTLYFMGHHSKTGCASINVSYITRNHEPSTTQFLFLKRTSDLINIILHHEKVTFFYFYSYLNSEATTLGHWNLFFFFLSDNY